MATQQLGPTPSRPTDIVDIAWITAAYPSFSATVVTDTDVLLDLPNDPIDHTMLLIEVVASSQVNVTLPVGTLLTVGAQPVTVVPLGKTAFFGLRYSETAGHWFLLSTTTQI